MPPFDGARAKFGWANQHLETLEAKFVSTFDKGITISLRQEFDPQNRCITVKFHDLPNIPNEWMLIAADALQNFRAALNYMAWELAKANLAKQGIGRDPVRTTEFPILIDPKRLNRKMIVDLSAAQWTAIEKVQPYHSGNLLAPNDPLALLQTYSNTDKHRMLQLGFVTPAIQELGRFTAHNCIVTDVNYFVVTPLEVDAEHARFEITPTGPNPRVDVNTDFTLTVAFSDGRFVYQTLVKIRDKIDTMIRNLEPLSL